MKAILRAQINCPHCSYALLLDRTEQGKDEMLYCPNPNCKQWRKPYAVPTIELKPWPDTSQGHG